MNLLGKQRTRDFIVVYSLVNLCFLSVWRELIFADLPDSYWLPSFTSATFAAALLNVAWLSALFWAMGTWTRRFGSRILSIFARLGFLMLLAFPIHYALRTMGFNETWVHWVTDNIYVSASLGMLVFVVGLYFLITRLSALTRVIATILIALSPFALLTTVQIAWHGIDSGGDRAAMATAEITTGTASPVRALKRVVWLMFDELDLRLAFTGRPENLILPEFDRLRSISMFASNAKSHSKNTEEAIPSYLTGKLVQQATPAQKDKLILKLENRPYSDGVSWTEFPTFFSEALKLGARTAIIGLYHPYCRIFKGAYDVCNWYALNTYAANATSSVPLEMYRQLLGILPIKGRINGLFTFHDMSKRAAAAVANTNYDVVYFHASVPHGPNIYDRKSGRFSLFLTAKDGYFGNLILADRLLGRLRRAMEKTGVWDETTVLVTSDHEWRHVRLYDGKRVRKVPFMLKSAGESTPLVYDKEFSPMLVAKDLLLAILKGEVSKPAEVVEFLDRASN